MAFLSYVNAFAARPIAWVETLVFADEPVNGLIKFTMAWTRQDIGPTELPPWIAKVIEEFDPRDIVGKHQCKEGSG